MTRILVVGDVMLDHYVFGEVDRVSPEAPVPVVKVTREEYRLGAAANVAHNCRTLGAEVTLMGIIGADDENAKLREACENIGINENKLVTVFGGGFRTTTKLRVIGRHQQVVRVDYEADPGDTARDELLARFKAALPGHDLVIISDYCKGAIRDGQAYIQAAGMVPVIVDTKTENYMPWRGALCVKQNEREFERAAGEGYQNNPEAVRDMNGLKSLLITKAEQGMTLYEAGQEPFDVPTVAREVFDVTGAGDTVIAALGTFISQGYSLRGAAVLANKAASVVVGKFGVATCSQAELCGD
jgi:rfaE bifunctional protein kinase chain/domain